MHVELSAMQGQQNVATIDSKDFTAGPNMPVLSHVHGGVQQYL